MAQTPEPLQAETQNLPAAGKSGCAAQALPEPHSASVWQVWQKPVRFLQVRSAVLQYWPLPQVTVPASGSALQPPTVPTHKPVKALQNLPDVLDLQASSLVQTQRRIS